MNEAGTIFSSNTIATVGNHAIYGVEEVIESTEDQEYLFDTN
mgnify:CR=1 FL=1